MHGPGETAEWLLPDGIDELLPPDAARLEVLRRRILDLFASYGFDLVEPPLVEFLGSLLSGSGGALDAATFKLTDPLAGRLLGVRADMTPQVARIDAHCLHRLCAERTVPTRLMYAGPTLHTTASGHGGTRNPLQIGAEIYGHASIAADVEVVCLLERTLALAGVPAMVLEVGHVGVIRGLLALADLPPEGQAALHGLLARKARDELAVFLRQAQHKALVAPEVAGWIAALNDLHGGPEVLAAAEVRLGGAPAPVVVALAQLRGFAEAINVQIPGAALHFDLGEMWGYQYYTGVSFAAYVAGRGQALARGGRYDGIGRRFGADRPATGFSADLKDLLPYSLEGTPPKGRIFAAAAGDPALDVAVAEARACGSVVVRALSGGSGGAAAHGCERIFSCRDGRWVVEDVVAPVPSSGGDSGREGA
jgi:ATP phosphoribosyltransferase regulatory subunit